MDYTKFIDWLLKTSCTSLTLSLKFEQMKNALGAAILTFLQCIVALLTIDRRPLTIVFSLLAGLISQSQWSIDNSQKPLFSNPINNTIVNLLEGFSTASFFTFLGAASQVTTR